MTTERASTELRPPETGPNGQWWKDGPVFSTEQKGSRITTLAPGAQPGRFTLSDVASAVGMLLFWAGFLFLAIPRVISYGLIPWVEEMTTQWWFYVIIVLAVIGMFVVGPTFGLYRSVSRSFGQLGIAALAVALVCCASAFIALAIHILIYVDYWSEPHPELESWEYPDEELFLILAIIAALATIACAVLLPVATIATRRVQAQVARLRARGSRHDGTITEMKFLHERVDYFVQFRVQVSWHGSDGPRTVRARMATIPARAPMLGATVIVYTEAVQRRNGTVKERLLLEPHPEIPMSFDPEGPSKYVVTSDGGS